VSKKAGKESPVDTVVFINCTLASYSVYTVIACSHHSGSVYECSFVTTEPEDDPSALHKYKSGKSLKSDKNSDTAFFYKISCASQQVLVNGLAWAASNTLSICTMCLSG
jgi:hypothetical protein